MPENDIYIRSIAGTVFVLVVVLLTISGFLPLFFLTIVISSVCIFEFLKMQKEDRFLPLAFALLLNLVILCSATTLASDHRYLLVGGIAFLPLIYLSISLFRAGQNILESVQYAFLSILYISLPFYCFLSFSSGDNDYNWQRPLLVFILVWASDTFAYVSGRLFGRTFLFPALSPKKTVEGWIGGTILAAVAGGIMAHYWPFIGLTNGIVLGILVSIFGTIGDLFESALKRKAGVKDSGKIIPGHGGLLDRFDAFIFASVVVYVWYFFMENV